MFAACPAAQDFLREVARNGGHLGGTTSRLLRMLDQYGAAALQLALAEAHRCRAFTAHSVAHVLEKQRRAAGAPVPLPVTLPDDPRVQGIVVTPHRLERYDELGGPSDAPEASS